MGTNEPGGDDVARTFQRRRRVAFRIRGVTMLVGLGGAAFVLLRLSRLHDLPDPPVAWFAAFGGAVAVFVLGALVVPQLYRCPRCHRRVEVPDPTESGGILLEDPDACPHCGVALKPAGAGAPSRGAAR